jgi:endonuclease/exonuclease/phosphatase (EEP) superfamily protein YafD
MIKNIAIAILAILGLLSIGSYFAWYYPAELLSHFRYQYLVIALLLAVSITLLQRYGLLKSKAILITSFLILGLNAIEILPWWLPHPQQVVHRSAQLRILSFNVHEKNTAYAAVIDLVRQDQPNVALFIEVDTTSVWCQKLQAGLQQTLPYSFCSSGAGLALFSDRPFQKVAVIDLEGFGQHLLADVTVDQQVLRFIGTHPFVPIAPATFQQRNLQLAALAKYIGQQPTPVIIAGDFNLSPWSPYYRQFIQATALHNARLGFGILPSWPYPTTFKKNLPSGLLPLLRIPIDHCLVSKELGVVNMRVSGQANSDHAAIVTDVVWR